MTTILASKIRPVILQNTDQFGDIFQICADSSYSELIRIAVGFISIDSITFLLENIRRNNINSCELIIGMHAFSGFTKSQYEVVTLFDQELRQQQKGFVKVCTAFPFHGKTYSFWRDNSAFLAIVGSSNLDSILKDDHLEYEVDIVVEDKENLTKLSNLHQMLSDSATKSLDEWYPEGFVSQGLFPTDYPVVKTLSTAERDEFWDKAREINFLLPLKTEPKSNLNCIFGKGRENTRTKVVRPRSWYEVEIIVNSEITSQIGYPRLKEFDVISDDGYRFTCRTQGDNSKNFRSSSDLKTLGMWIKGRMEEEGVLKVGERVTESTLNNFGKHFINLISTDDPNLWLIKLI